MSGSRPGEGRSPARPALYLVSDRRLAAGGDLVRVVAAVAAALPPGQVAVQVREKDLGTRDLAALAAALIAVARPRGCPVLINDRLDVALAVGADGVHLPERGLDVAAARALAGPGFLIGASTHHPDLAVGRARAGADLVVLGPIWATPSKAGQGAPLGCAAVAGAAAGVRAAGAGLYAIGGVTDPTRAARAIAAGASGVAAIRAVLGAADPAAAARALCRAVVRTPVSAPP